MLDRVPRSRTKTWRRSTFEGDEEPTLLDAIAAASVQGKSAICSENGLGVERAVDLEVALQRDGTTVRRAPLCAEVDGFSLHAAVRTCDPLPG